MKMIDYIREMPYHIEGALKYDEIKIKITPQVIVFSGMGGSAIAGDLISKALLDRTKYFSQAVRDYKVPDYVNDRTLAIVTSYSGNTEETLSAYEDAKKKGAYIVTITSGGKLSEMANRDGFPVLKVPEGYPPRAALGYLFTLSLKVLVDNGILNEKLLQDMDRTRTLLLNLQKEMEEDDSVARKIADKFYKRIPLIYAQASMRPVAERWRAQINENAKAFAHSNEFSEMNHNEIAGILHPESLVKQFFAVYLDDGNLHERLKLRYVFTDDLTRDSISGSLTLHAEGESLLERMFYLIYVGDYVSVFLADYYNEDAVKIERISELKRRLSG